MHVSISGTHDGRGLVPLAALVRAALEVKAAHLLIPARPVVAARLPRGDVAREVRQDPARVGDKDRAAVGGPAGEAPVFVVAALLEERRVPQGLGHVARFRARDLLCPGINLKSVVHLHFPQRGRAGGQLLGNFVEAQTLLWGKNDAYSANQ